MANLKLNIDKAVKTHILNDGDVHRFLRPILKNSKERAVFIKKCLKKTKTRRMLNHAHWYIEIADAQDKVKYARPALKVIFLMSLAEYIAKEVYGGNLGSEKAIQAFFKWTTKEDKEKIKNGIKRLIASRPHHSLYFRSIVNILYNVRNKAVHGEDYYSFSLPEPKYKEAHVGYDHWGLIVPGELTIKPRKRTNIRKKHRISLDISITYEELREIFIRTAINGIKSLIR